MELHPWAARAVHDCLLWSFFFWSFIMNVNNRIFSVLPAVLLAAALGLSGCAGMNQQERGTTTGAVVGGAAGAVLGGGVLGTAAGAVVGGVIGHEVTKPK
jgi:osmotically inducible lipoprotein OsmB